ncbi:MAG TPA: response regulator [Patescibacteria group bacterium]|nr:response regulator [Patescibacteria group bacterium]
MPEFEVDLLLVEDSPEDAELTLYSLRRNNLANRIYWAKDGEEGLDFLLCRNAFSGRSFQHPPKVILLDLKLPKVDGLEVLRQLKEDPRTKSIPVVVLTSSREESDVVRGYRNGANSYVQKPVDFEQFREAVRQLGLYWVVTNEPPPEATFSRG